MDMTNVIGFTPDGRVRVWLPKSMPAPQIGGALNVADNGAEYCYEMDWTQRNMWLLAHHQVINQYWVHYPHMRVVSRILGDYAFPGKFRPYHHQLRIANFLTSNRRAFCFADMGTGKTAAAIWAAEYLMQIGAVKNVLVACPKTILYAAWQSDLRDI